VIQKPRLPAYLTFIVSIGDTHLRIETLWFSYSLGSRGAPLGISRFQACPEGTLPAHPRLLSDMATNQPGGYETRGARGDLSSIVCDKCFGTLNLLILKASRSA